MMTFVAISRIDIDESMADRLEDSFRERSRQVDSVDGFLGLLFLRSKKNPNEFRGIFRFIDEESFKNCMKSDMHSKSHDKTHQEMTAAIKTNSLEFFKEITQ
ncbi:MAG: antibiotic biosynthesis monooxygenase [Nitrosopumilus sp.]|nr:antibiotic biosynthesis monooxygenase [Nitrosopumilus sp.]MDH3487159.1 antibiotic biosynthesis monooxygenase [Nitrosopumilus sp.]